MLVVERHAAVGLVNWHRKYHQIDYFAYKNT